MALLEKLNKLTAQNIFLDDNTGGKGRYYKSRFLQPGLVKYSFGVCVLTKETIDKFVDGFVGCPVIINHKDVTNENAKEERVGVISRVWYDDKDGWFWCEGVIFEEEAISLIEDGYNVSCQYEITEYSNNTTKALHNGNPYDKVILNGKPEHLAIVKTPRYENAMIAVNAIDLTADNARGFGGEEGDWITVKGVHIFVKKGQSKEEAVKQFIDSKQGEKSDKPKTSDNPDKTKTYTEDTYDEFHKKFYKEHNDKWTFQRTTKGYDVHRTNENKKWEFNQDLKKENLDKYLTDEVVKLRLPNIPKKDKNGGTEFQEDTKNLQLFKDKGYEPSDKYDDGYYTNYILKKSDTKDGKSGSKSGDHSNIKQSRDEHGRLILSKDGSNKKVKIHKNGDYYLASYGQELKDDDGYTEFQLFPGASGKTFKTESGAIKWANKMLAENELEKNTIIEAINELKENNMFNKLFKKKEKQMDKDELKSLFMDCIQDVLKAQNEAEEEDIEEKDAENEEEDEKEEKAENKKACNEDKRKLIDEVAGMMKSAGCDDEVIRTAIAKMEKIGYEKSEAETVDNCGKKGKNEEVEVEEKEEKEEAKNKAKNSIEALKGLLSSGEVSKPASKYITKSQAIELGNQLF